MTPGTRTVAAVVLPLIWTGLVAPGVRGWGDEGHRYVSRVAVEQLP